MTWAWQAIDFHPWHCRACGRTVLLRADTRYAVCVGGWILIEPTPIPWHEATTMRRLPDEEVDPIELAKKMGLMPR